MRDILPVDQDAPALRIVEAKQQPRDRALARARGADDRQRRPGGHLEAEAVEDRAILVVAEHDVVEGYRRPADHQRRGAGDILDLDPGVHQVKHLRHVDQPLADRAIDHAQQVERAEELEQIGVHEHQIAHGQLAAAPAPDRVGHGARHQRIGDQRLGDVEQAERGVGLDRGLGVSVRRAGVALLLAVFGAEIFDRLVVEQRVDRARQRSPVEIVHLAAQIGAPFGDPLGDDDIGHHRHCG